MRLGQLARSISFHCNLILRTCLSFTLEGNKRESKKVFLLIEIKILRNYIKPVALCFHIWMCFFKQLGPQTKKVQKRIKKFFSFKSVRFNLMGSDECIGCHSNELDSFEHNLEFH